MEWRNARININYELEIYPLALFCQPSDCFCDEETGAGVCWCSLERLHICFIIITAATPMTMPETRFSFAVKNILDSACFISLQLGNGYCVGADKSVRQYDTTSFVKRLWTKKEDDNEPDDHYDPEDELKRKMEDKKRSWSLRDKFSSRYWSYLLSSWSC